jgi:predicted anti-sigma-YlaC factor YlaD
VKDEMTCRELVDLTTEYLEGTMPDADRTRFEAHLAECGPCTNYLHQMRRTIELAGRLTEASFPPGAADELLHAFRSWKQDR